MFDKVFASFSFLTPKNLGKFTPSYTLHTHAFRTYLFGGLFTLQKRITLSNDKPLGDTIWNYLHHWLEVKFDKNAWHKCCSKMLYYNWNHKTKTTHTITMINLLHKLFQDFQTFNDYHRQFPAKTYIDGLPPWLWNRKPPSCESHKKATSRITQTKRIQLHKRNDISHY
jgi:hypothetical protein